MRRGDAVLVHFWGRCSGLRDGMPFSHMIQYDSLESLVKSTSIFQISSMARVEKPTLMTPLWSGVSTGGSLSSLADGGWTR